MVSTIVAQAFDSGSLIDLDSDTFAEGEYRFSGWVDGPFFPDTTSFVTAANPVKLFVASRVGKVTVRIMEDLSNIWVYEVTPGFPLYIDIPSYDVASLEIIPDSPGAHIELLTFTTGVPVPVAGNRFLWLRADQGVVKNELGLVLSWVDTRGDSLAPSKFTYGTHANSPFVSNDDIVVVSKSEKFNKLPTVKFKGQPSFADPAFARLLYTGTEFTGGAATAASWTICMVVNFADKGAHGIVASSCNNAAGVNTLGAFVGAEGGGMPYYGSASINATKFDQAYKTVPVEVNDEPVILVYRYDDVTRTMDVFYRGTVNSQVEAFTAKPSFFNPLILGGIHCSNLFGTTGINTTYQMFEGELADFQYHPRKLSIDEVLQYRATNVAKYAIRDEPLDTFPWVDAVVDIWKTNRGVQYNPLDGDVGNIWDTRRKATTNPMVKASSTGTVVISELNGRQCVEFTGPTSELMSTKAASVYDATTGGSSFNVGVVAQVTGAGSRCIWNTTGNYGAKGAIIGVDVGYTAPIAGWIINQNVGVPAKLNDFMPGFVVPPPPYNLCMLVEKGPSSAELRALGQSVLANDLFTESAQAATRALRIGGTPGIQSGATAATLVGLFHEAWFLGAVTTPQEKAQYERYIQRTYGFTP